MEIRYPQFINVTDRRQVAKATNAIIELSAFLGFSKEQQSNLAIAVSEAGTNLTKHTRGKGGEIIILAEKKLDSVCIEFIAIDNGPGMANTDIALTDLYSTTDTMGTGLGAIKRLMDEFYIYSYPDKGTVVMAKMWLNSRPDMSQIEYSVINKPKAYEEVSGDNWTIREDVKPIRTIVVDGLGHGKDAAVSADKAVDIFLVNNAPLDKLVTIIDENLRNIRGTVLSMAELFPEQEKINFISIGNIFSRIIIGDNAITLFNHYGIVGTILPTLEIEKYKWPSMSLLIMHSDGLNTHWDLKDYPGLTYAHPSIIAAILYRDYNRGNDDIVVMVIRNKVGSF